MCVCMFLCIYVCIYVHVCIYVCAQDSPFCICLDLHDRYKSSLTGGDQHAQKSSHYTLEPVLSSCVHHQLMTYL